jgi:hypothetical protein
LWYMLCCFLEDRLLPVYPLLYVSPSCYDFPYPF